MKWPLSPLVAVLVAIVGCASSGTRVHRQIIDQEPAANMRHIVLRLVDSSGKQMPWNGTTSQVTARTGSGQIEMRYDRQSDVWWGSAPIAETFTAQVIRVRSDAIHVEIPPDSTGDEGEEIIYEAVLRPYTAEYVPTVSGWKQRDVPTSFIGVSYRDSSSIPSVQRVLDSLGLRSLTNRELYVLGVDMARRPQYDSLVERRWLIAVKQNGGEFNRLDCAELRALRAHPVVAGANSIIEFTARGPLFYSRRLVVRVKKPLEGIEQSLKQMNLHIVQRQVVFGDTVSLVVLADDGVGRGVYDVVRKLEDVHSIPSVEYAGTLLNDFSDD